MAFNPTNYVKDADKSFTNRMIDSVVANATAGQPNSTKTIARTVASTLINTGATLGSAAGSSSSSVDGAVSSSADEFYALAGRNPARASRVTIESLRRKSSTQTYMENSNPATKIAKSRGNNEMQIITVV